MNPRQKFLEHALRMGLECKTLSTSDVTKHCDPDVLANHLPPKLKAKLLSSALSADKMDADLIVDVVGTEALAENVPMGVLWACIAEAAGRALGDTAASAGDKHATAKKPNTKSGSKTKQPAKPAAAKPAATVKPAAARPAATAKPAGATSKKHKGLAPGANKPRIPKNEFDVDTDVGHDVAADDEPWDDDIVEVVEEDVIGASTSVVDEIASDWARDEETVTRDVK